MNILVSVMNWGLGHATRCIPIIKSLSLLGHKVSIASDGHALHLLKSEFPDLIIHTLPSYNISYGKNMAVAMMKQAPQMLVTRSMEHNRTQQIVAKDKIDFIISDQRYGCYSTSIKSIFITHQVHLPLEGLEKAVGQRIHNHWMSPFNEIWIPDNQANRLAGKLSAAHDKLPTHYLGILSRFIPDHTPINNYEIDYLAIISGPEPNRSQLEKLLLTQFNNSAKKCILVKGIAEGKANIAHSNTESVTSYNFCDSNMLKTLITQSNHIITRSGYTSLMDLAALEKAATLIPTQCQAEQVYLAEHVSKNRWSDYQNPEDFDLDKIQNLTFNKWPSVISQNSLTTRLHELLN